MRDIHAMGAIRTLLAAVINAAAVVTFILAGAVFWPYCLMMISVFWQADGLARITRKKLIPEKYAPW